MEELNNLLRIQKNDLEVHEWLGAGNTTAVFKGIWHHDGEALEVAIKKMALYERDASEVSRAIKAMLNHSFENVRKFHGGCVTDDETQVWLVMEYANRGDLHYYLRSLESPLSEDFQLSLIIQATKALAALHNAPSQILHSNINSRNFLVQNDLTLLLDFGISKARPSGAENNIDKIRWMAPEIISTNNGHSAKSDIFSLGMVFYEIITCKSPYSDLNIPQILDKIKRGVWPKFPADCPQEWKKLIHRCWNYKPEKRPNVNELLVMWEKIAATLNSPKVQKKLAQSSELNPSDLVLPHSDSDFDATIQMPAPSRRIKSLPPTSTISRPPPTIMRSLSANAANGGEKSRTKGLRKFFSSIRKASDTVFGRKKDKRRETEVKREVIPALYA